MFGLIYFAGALLMAWALMMMLCVFFAMAYWLKCGMFGSILISATATVGILYAINAEEIQATREFNALCEVRPARRVGNVIGDVDGVRVRGDVGPNLAADLGDKYEYIEWEQAPLKWRVNYASAEICGRNRSCNVEAFSARYEVEVRSEAVTRKVHLFEMRVFDSATGATLASDRGYSLSRDSMDSVERLFLGAWRWPAETIVAPAADCSFVDPDRFLNSVLTPRAKNQ